MHTAVFDIDGTLLDSFDADAELYVEAIRQVLGDVAIRDAWEMYPHVSDTGILAEICVDNGLQYEDQLSDDIRDVFLGKLNSHMRLKGPYPQIPGALRYVNELLSRADTRVAYATGGWRASAELKLSSAGFPVQGVPLASANDHKDRKQIMLHALGQLDGPFESITYYGDGVWDSEATAALGWRFVPVGLKLGGILDFSAVSPNNPMQRAGSR